MNIKRNALIICVIFITMPITGCVFNNEIKYIGKTLQINVDNCKIERQIDTHGGFLGDGDYFAKIVCTEETSEIAFRWKKLPLSEDLQKVIDMKQCNNNGCYNVYERYNIPIIQHGYYYFIDRHSESIDKHSDEKINERPSYNFSLGIYDNDNKVLYYYELDT